MLSPGRTRKSGVVERTRCAELHDGCRRRAVKTNDARQTVMTWLPEPASPDSTVVPETLKADYPALVPLPLELVPLPLPLTLTLCPCPGKTRCHCFQSPETDPLNTADIRVPQNLTRPYHLLLLLADATCRGCMVLETGRSPHAVVASCRRPSRDSRFSFLHLSMNSHAHVVPLQVHRDWNDAAGGYTRGA